MIVKIKSRKNKSFRQLIEYMLHDKGRIRPDQDGFVIAHNLRGNSIEDWVAQLKANDDRRTVRRKDSVRMYHEILSWHADDARHITPEKMEQMTREYIRLLGITGSYLAVPHYNTSHYHVHLLVSGVDRDGKAMRMSRAELGELKKNIQQYQIAKFPELTKSVVAHGRKAKQQTSEKEVQPGVYTKKMSVREQVRTIVLECHEQSVSQEDFFARLKAHRMETYVRGGRAYGVAYDGKKYRFSTLGIESVDHVAVDFQLVRKSPSINLYRSR